MLLFKDTMLKLFCHVVIVNPFFFFHAVICLGCMLNLACIDFMPFSVFKKTQKNNIYIYISNYYNMKTYIRQNKTQG